MTSAANELLQAIHARLSGDPELTAAIGSDGIRDRPVDGRHLPAIVLSELSTGDYATATEPGEEHLFTLQVWSDAAGRARALDIAGMVRERLCGTDLPLEAHALVNFLHVATKSRREPKTRLFCAEVRFRAVTE